MCHQFDGQCDFFCWRIKKIHEITILKRNTPDYLFHKVNLKWNNSGCFKPSFYPGEVHCCGIPAEVINPLKSGEFSRYFTIL
jgi:hypothetical protein